MSTPVNCILEVCEDATPEQLEKLAHDIVAWARRADEMGLSPFYDAIQVDQLSQGSLPMPLSVRKSEPKEEGVAGIKLEHVGPDKGDLGPHLRAVVVGYEIPDSIELELEKLTRLIQQVVEKNVVSSVFCMPPADW